VSPAAVAFAIAIEQATAHGRALGLSDERIHEDIARALQGSAASTADTLAAVVRRWSTGVER
jgi:hypothetical protein